MIKQSHIHTATHTHTRMRVYTHKSIHTHLCQVCAARAAQGLPADDGQLAAEACVAALELLDVLVQGVDGVNAHCQDHLRKGSRDKMYVSKGELLELLNGVARLQHTDSRCLLLITV